MTDESDEIDRLVAAVVDCDRAALNQLLVILRPLVVRYCRSRLGSDRAGVAADDVAQEVCLAVLKSLPTYTDQGKPFLAFVYGIAAHKVVDAHRHAGRDRSDPTDELPEGFADMAGPEQHALEMSASAEMRVLLAQLPAKQREILVLRVVVGLSAEETALAVGSTPGAVRVAQHRAVAKLRGVLGDPDEPPGPDDTPARGLAGVRVRTPDAAGTRTGRRGRA